MKHTPGPWLVSDERADVLVVSFDHAKNAEMPIAFLTGTANSSANARLIAAAPELHAALTIDDIDQIIEGIENFCMGPVEDEELDAIWLPYIDKLNALKAAIQKAKGLS